MKFSKYIKKYSINKYVFSFCFICHYICLKKIKENNEGPGIQELFFHLLELIQIS
jgi:hypothetical protein